MKELKTEREAELDYLLQGTNFQVLQALIPDIRKRFHKADQRIVNEIIKRSEQGEGFRPFHWTLGCL